MGAVFFLFKRGNMGKNREKTDDFAPNPLVESGVGKMIQVIRGKQVLLDRDLATLYGVETKRINEQVKRNIERFPAEFCFQLDKLEFENWKSQFATSNSDKMGLRKAPFAFTEQGVAMLSAVLHSEKAISVSIDIMKAFVAMRHYMMLNGGFVNRLANVESKVINQDARLLDHDRKFDEVFEAMDRGELKSKGLYYNNSVHRRYGLPLRSLAQGLGQKHLFLYARRFYVGRSAEGIADDALKQIDDKGYLIPYTANQALDGMPKRLFKIGVSFDAERRTLGEWKVAEE